ncbi:MAG TPA: DUF2332 domain-containing protein [Rhizomicrobium sp.]|nr:DUF2332 domain-containing protein [Rhizomicrobium sp.]
MAGFDYWTFFVAEARRLHAPLYVRLSEGIGGDADLRALAETARPGQPPANMILAAAHFLLLRGAKHPLRDFYPNLADKVADGDPFPAFRDFVAQRRDEMARLVATRVTNTNEVGRSAALHAGFRALAARAGEPLHLIEIGPSAGLNTIWDSYGVRYDRDGERFATDAPDGALVIDTVLRGTRVPPLGPAPEVASRVGLERNPVDLGDRDSRDWLRALVWPDHRARLERLDRALEIYAHGKPDIRAGDALELLPEALAEAPANETVCVYHTVVTYQFPQEAREALDNMLIAAGVRRPVWRLSLEFAGENYHPLRLTRYADGVKATEELALCDPHVAWIEWLV